MNPGNVNESSSAVFPKVIFLKSVGHILRNVFHPSQDVWRVVWHILWGSQSIPKYPELDHHDKQKRKGQILRLQKFSGPS